MFKIDTLLKEQDQFLIFQLFLTNKTQVVIQLLLISEKLWTLQNMNFKNQFQKVLALVIIPLTDLKFINQSGILRQQWRQYYTLFKIRTRCTSRQPNFCLFNDHCFIYYFFNVKDQSKYQKVLNYQKLISELCFKYMENEKYCTGGENENCKNICTI